MKTTWRRPSAGISSRIALAITLFGAALVALPASAVTVSPFTSAQGFDADIYGDYILVGNTVVRCPTGAETTNGDPNNNATTCATSATSNSGAASTSAPNDNFTMRYADIDGVASTFNSSSVSVNIPPGSTVAKAKLFWGGHTGVNFTSTGSSIVSCNASRPSAGAPEVALVPSGSDAASTAAGQPVKFTVNGATTTLSNSFYSETPTVNTVYSAGRQYVASVDVTSILDNAPRGVALPITTANVWTPQGYNCHGGWGLMVVYKYPAPNATYAPVLRRVSAFDGYVDIQATDPTATTTTISGFTISSGVKRVGAIAWEGDQNIQNDTLTVRGNTGTATALTEPRTGLTNNFMSSTADGKLDPAVNNTWGIDAKSVNVPAGAINVGDTSIDLSFDTNGDRYGASFFAFSGPVVGATLSGNVFVDPNQNGTKDGGETTPVPGTVVTLKDNSDNTVATTTTDGSGNYTFSTLPGGAYVVETTLPGSFVQTSSTPQVSVNVPTGGSSVVNVGAILPSISGTVRNQTSGNGLGNVTIEVLDSSNNVVQTTQTLADGTYSFTGLTAGSYSIRETQPSNFLDANTNPVVPGSSGGTTSTNLISGVSVVDGVTSTGNDFNEIPPASIAGTVTNVTTSSPISGVSIALTGTDDKGAAVSLTTTTATDGSYSFANLRPGSYAVVESQPSGFASAAVDPAVAGSTGGTPTIDAINGISVVAGSASTGNDFHEVQVSSIAGRVLDRSSGSTPLGGVTVTLAGTDDLGNPVSASTTTLANGTYAFNSLRPGTYAVTETQPSGYLDAATDPVVVGSEGGSAALNAVNSIVLAAGRSSTGNDFNEVQPGTISGSVLNAATSAGLTGVTMSLSGLDDLGNSVTATTTTATDGSYSFVSLRPGTYAVTETQPTNFFDAATNPVVVGSGGGTATTNAVNSIALSAGAASTGNDFREVQRSTISGSVLNHLDSSPIAGVTITLTGTDDLGNPVSMSTTTASDGTYTFTNLRPGTYAVTETQPANWVEPVGGGVTPGSLGGTSASNAINAIVLTGGSASTGNNFSELPAAAVRGTVFSDLDNNGTKTSGEAGIELATVTLTGTDDLGNPVNLSTVTANDGTYSFTGLRPGTYSVTETQPVAYLDGKDSVGSAAGTLGSDQVTAISLSAGVNAAGYDFGELSPASIAGSVFEDLDGSTTKSAGDPAITTVTLTLTGTDDLGNPVTRTTVSATDGTYSFGGLRPGTYTVTETQPTNYVDGPTVSGSLGGTAGVNQTDSIVVTAGNSGTGYDFGETPTADVAIAKTVISAGPFRVGQLVTYRVTVSNAGPSTATSIVVTETWPAGITFQSGVAASGSYSSATNTWTIPSLASGASTTLDLTARVDSETPGTNRVNITSTGTIDPTTTDHQATASIPTATAAAVTGSVYIDADNDGQRGGGEQGIGGVLVTLTGTNDLGAPVTSTTLTAGDGTYSFGGLRPGTYRVDEAQPSGFLDGTDRAGSTPGSVTGSDQITNIVLTPGAVSASNVFGELQGASISGRVTNQLNGDPIANTTITLTGTDDLGNPVTLSTTTGVDGSYAFPGLRPGTYAVTEMQPAGWLEPLSGGSAAGGVGGTPATNQVTGITLSSGTSAASYNFSEIPPSSVSGAVVNATTGAPLAAVTVSLAGTDDLGNPVNLVTTTASDGTYTFNSLRPGTYSVTETQPAGFFNPLTGAVNPGSTGGTAGTDTITSIPVGPGSASTGNNFAELTPSQVSGVVRDRTTGDPIQAATVTLTGTDDLGAPISLTTTTAADGTFLFSGLRPGTYSLIETQPANWLNPADGGVIPGTAGGTAGPNSLASIVVAPGTNSTGNVFEEIAPTVISGIVREAGSGDPIAGVSLTLSGTDDLGAPVNATVLTAADGSYAFAGLRPGTYTVVETQPGGWFDPLGGGVTAGTSGGTVSNNTIGSIVLAAGVPSTGNNFEEIAPSTVSGAVTDIVTGDPIGGVTLTLSGNDDLGNPVSATVNTAPNGTYSFTGLRPGTYTVTETQPTGWLEPRTGGTTVGSSGGTAAPDTISSIVLLAGTASTANDFAELQPSKVAGVVFADRTNNGTLDGPDGRIDGVSLTLTGTDDLGNSVSVTTTSLVDGTFSFDGLRPGSYTLVETQPTSHLDGTDTAGSIGTLNGNDSVTMSLGNAQQSVDNLFGELVPSTISGTVFGDLNNDGIVNVGDTGIGGVAVTLTGTDDRGNTVSLTTTTASDGTYSFGSLRPGSYTVTETQPAGVFDGTDAFGTNGSTANGNDSFSVTLAAETSSNANNFGEIPPVSISGSVFLDMDLSGTKTTGEPGVGGVLITLTGTDDLGAPVSATTTTSASGTWTFDGLRPGTYSVNETQPSGLQDGGDEAGTMGATAPSNDRFDVTLLAGQRSTDNNFGEIGPSTISGVVYVDANGNGIQDGGESGIAGVAMTLSGVDASGASVNRTATTSADGTWSFADLSAGTYTVTESQPNGFVDGAERAGNGGSPSANDAITVTLPASTQSTGHQFAELPLSSISGSVYVDEDGSGDRNGGEPGIEGVTLTLTGFDDNGLPVRLTTVSSSDGAWAFLSLRPGTYVVTESQPGNLLDGSEVSGTGASVTGNDQISVTLPAGLNSVGNRFGELRTGGVSGVVFEDLNGNGVVDPGEPGIAGVLITLTGTDDGGNTVSLTTTTRPDGSWSFQEVRPGSYSVKQTQPNDFLDGKDTPGGQASASGNDTFAVSVVAGKPSNGNNFSEVKPSTITGTVFADKNANGVQDSDEPGIAGVTVTMVGTDDLGNPVTRTVVTGPDGKWSFDGVRPGVYSVTETQPKTFVDGVETPGTGTTSTPGNDSFTITVGSGQTSTGNRFAELPPASANKGSIGDLVFLDRNGDGKRQADEPGLGGVTVTLTMPDGSTRTTTTLEDGSYEFVGLPPGEYVVTIESAENLTNGRQDRTVTLKVNENIDDVDFALGSNSSALGNILALTGTDGFGLMRRGLGLVMVGSSLMVVSRRRRRRLTR